MKNLPPIYLFTCPTMSWYIYGPTTCNNKRDFRPMGLGEMHLTSMHVFEASWMLDLSVLRGSRGTWY